MIQVTQQLSDQDYFGSYNNMIFLQKSAKTHKKFRKHEEEEFNIVEQIDKMVYPEDSTEITF